MNDKSNPARHRFWPRFTLRVLLAVVTLVAVGLGYWTHRAREQARVVKLIQEGGGMVCYERDGPTAPEPRNFVVEWLAKFLSRDYLERVDFAIVHDRDSVRELYKLSGLVQLKISFESLSNDDLMLLSRCNGLHALQLGDMYFTGAHVPKPRISDKSLHMIARMPKLQIAQVYGASFTPEGIDALASSALSHLEIGLCEESVDANDFDQIRQRGQIQTLRSWRATQSSLGFEEIVKW